MGVEPLDVIHVPGRGMVNSEALAVDAALREYDDRLRFGFNEANKDWVVYIKMPRNFDAAYFIEGEPVYPVLGFGENVPTVHEAIERIRQADTRRGTDMLKRINRENILLGRHQDQVASDFNGEIAERLEFELRKQGLSPIVKVFFRGS